MSSTSRRHRLQAMALPSLAVVPAVAVLPTIPQPQQYHDFADQRTVLGLPHALNTASSLGFLIVGGFGLLRLRRVAPSFIDSRESRPCRHFLFSLVSVGVVLTFYHLAPSHHTLSWDRQPMSLAFVSLFSAVLIERRGPSGWAARSSRSAAGSAAMR